MKKHAHIMPLNSKNSMMYHVTSLSDQNTNIFSVLLCNYIQVYQMSDLIGQSQYVLLINIFSEKVLLYLGMFKAHASKRACLEDNGDQSDH